MESLKSTREEYDVQWDRYIGESYEDCELFWDNLKDNLLQSQIKVIDELIKYMEGEIIICSGIDINTLGAKIYNRALEDQISSLNQVKEELTKNL